MELTPKQTQIISQIATQVVAQLRPFLSQQPEGQTTNLQKRVEWLEDQVQAMKEYLRELVSQNKAQANLAPNSQPEQSQKAKPQQPNQVKPEPDEQKAEQWARENLEQWIDQACPFRKAQGRTWRELAENKGDKIDVNGRLSSPRAYLHALTSWRDCKVWQRTKAKVALDVVKIVNVKSTHSEAIAG
jgi:hypothetical protein